MKKLLKLLMVLALAAFLSPMVGCEKDEGPLEEAGEKIEEAAEDAKDKVEDATD